MLIWLSIQVYQIIHLIRNLRATKHEVALAESGEAVLELLRSRATPQSKRTRLRPSVRRAVHIILWKEGASRHACIVSRIDVQIAVACLCTNCARIQRFHSVRVTFERKADSPICW